MRLQSLREAVYEANMEVQRRGLVLYSFGNASGIDRESGIMAIKPSGVPYEHLSPANMVLVDLDNKTVEGNLKPSSDTKTHTALYRAWDDIGGVVHTHSSHATAWCQAARSMPCYGTTHADYAHGEIPCTTFITPQQTKADYEHETGSQILDAFASRDHRAVPMVLIAGHAPFTWGSDPAKAAFHAVVLEELARMALMSEAINPQIKPLPSHITDLHYMRKNGPNATYGQK